MHSQSNQPRIRSKFLSGLKSSEKLNKDLGISSSNYASSRNPEAAQQTPQTLNECDPTSEALARWSHTSSSYRSHGQRTTKFSIRGTTLPKSPTFRPRVVDTSADEMGRTNVKQYSDTQAFSLRSKARAKPPLIPAVKQSLDECDPLVMAIAQYIHTPTPSRYTQQRSDDRILLLGTIARYTDTTTSYKYAQQRSVRASHRTTLALENATPRPRLIVTPDQADAEVYVGDSSDDDFVSLACEHATAEHHRKTSQPSDHPHLSIEFPSHLLQIDTDVFQWAPSKPIRELTPRVHQSIPLCTVTSNVSESPVSPSPSATSTYAPANEAAWLKTPSTSSTIQRPTDIYPSPIRAATGSWKVKRKPVTSNPVFQLRPTDECLLGSPPSPATSSINRRGPSGEVLAGLDFMANLCARRTPDVSLDLERSETSGSAGACSFS